MCPRAKRNRCLGTPGGPRGSRVCWGLGSTVCRVSPGGTWVHPGPGCSVDSGVPVCTGSFGKPEPPLYPRLGVAGTPRFSGAWVQQGLSSRFCRKTEGSVWRLDPDARRSSMLRLGPQTRSSRGRARASIFYRMPHRLAALYLSHGSSTAAGFSHSFGIVCASTIYFHGSARR